MNNPLKSFLLLSLIIALTSCASKKRRNITYLEDSKALVQSLPKLDIYQPRTSNKKPVIIFVHGGYWESGCKGMYSFLGRNMAKKDLITVIPNYTLSPEGNYKTMTEEVAEAIQWTYKSIEKFGGDSSQIFLMGHSAGGHLIALAGTGTNYLENTNIVKGIILNDAAGLDMYTYLRKNPPTKKHHYNITWTDEPKKWKDASPIFSITQKSPPFLIYVGTKSYPAIISSNRKFVQRLKKYQPTVKINYIDKTHVAMMTQYISSNNRYYNEIVDFIKKH